MQVVDGHEEPDAAAPAPPLLSRAKRRVVRLRAGARLLVAVVAALACAAWIWRHEPNVLRIRTDIVGYPTFYGFDFTRYFAAFALLAVLTPTLVFAVDHLLGLGGPLRRPRRTEPLFPLRARRDPDGEVAPGRGLRPLSAGARLGLVGLAVALEVSAGWSSATRTFEVAGLAAGVLYVALVLLVARPWQRPGALTRLSRANALSSPLVVLLLGLVSAQTSVTVAQDAKVVHYPWLPWWLVVAGAVVAEVYALVQLRAADEATTRRIEGRLLAAVVGTAVVYLAVSGLTGAQGPLDAFDPQEIAGAQLVFVHGLLPWRDIFLLHGPLEDAIDGWVGLSVLSHTTWGALAGTDLFVYPASACVFYLFVVYFARGNRVVALLGALLVLGGFTAAIMRFAFLPVVVVLFDRLLRRRTLGSAAAFSGVLVLECVLVPEMLLLAAALGVTLIARDAASSRRGTPGRFRLVRDVVMWGAAFGALFAVYLVATRSFSGFVDYFRLFTSDHALWGARPVAWSWGTQLRFTAYFLLPAVVAVGTVARTVALVRTRRPLSARDWTLVGCALFALIYFQKGLDRTDISHVIEVYTASTPLILLAGISVLERVELVAARAMAALARARRERRHPTVPRTRRSVGAPIALCGVVTVLATTPGIVTRVRNAPGADHASAPVAASFPRLGYEVPGDFPTAEVNTLARLLSVYAGPTSPVFDFANEPVVTYFLLDRVPGTSFFHSEMAETAPAQQLVVSQLRASRPRVVIYTSQNLGLGLAYDTIPGMVRQWKISGYLLTHYTPIADAYGQLLMLRDDLVGTVQSVASLHLAGVSTSGLYFAGQSCAWGDVPNYFPAPRTVPGSAQSLTVSGGAHADYRLTGWAVDAHVLAPAGEVYAVSDGRVIGTAHPSLYRLDIQDYFHTPAVVDSGWSMDVEIAPNKRAQVYSINRDGTVSRLQPNPAPSWLASSPALKKVIGPDGHMHTIVRGHWLPGWTNFATRISARVYQLTVPAGVTPADDQWLTFRSRASLGGARYVFGDLPAETGHQVSFTALRSAGHALSVRVGSCLDWHGFGHHLELVVDRPGSRAPAPLTVTVAKAVAG